MTCQLANHPLFIQYLSKVRQSTSCLEPPTLSTTRLLSVLARAIMNESGGGRVAPMRPGGRPLAPSCRVGERVVLSTPGGRESSPLGPAHRTAPAPTPAAAAAVGVVRTLTVSSRARVMSALLVSASPPVDGPEGPRGAAAPASAEDAEVDADAEVEAPFPWSASMGTTPLGSRADWAAAAALGGLKSVCCVPQPS